MLNIYTCVVWLNISSRSRQKTYLVISKFIFEFLIECISNNSSMVDKLHDYQGPVGQFHTIRDNIKLKFSNWKEKNKDLDRKMVDKLLHRDTQEASDNSLKNYDFSFKFRWVSSLDLLHHITRSKWHNFYKRVNYAHKLYCFRFVTSYLFTTLCEGCY